MTTVTYEIQKGEGALGDSRLVGDKATIRVRVGEERELIMPSSQPEMAFRIRPVTVIPPEQTTRRPQEGSKKRVISIPAKGRKSKSVETLVEAGKLANPRKKNHIEAYSMTDFTTILIEEGGFGKSVQSYGVADIIYGIGVKSIAER